MFETFRKLELNQNILQIKLLVKKRRFAISDIHGCLKTFKQLLETIGLQKSDTLFLLGDYVDRGPDSVGVVRYIRTLILEDYDIVCLMGNHDEALIKRHSTSTMIWERLGGRGFRKKEIDPEGTWQGWQTEDLYFLARLKYFHETEDFILVHAGLNFKWNDPLKDTDSMLRIRNWYAQINYDWLGNRIIVHGHTALKKPDIEYLFKNLRHDKVINIDCSCAYNVPNESFLCAFNLDDLSLTFQANIED